MIVDLSSILLTLIGLFPNLAVVFKQNKNHKLGRALTQFYFGTLNCIWLGEVIVNRVRNLLNTEGDKPPRDWEGDLASVNRFIDEQRIAIGRLQHDMWNLEKELNLVDPVSAHKLLITLPLKLHTLAGLQSELYYFQDRLNKEGEESTQFYAYLQRYLTTNPPEERLQSMKESAESIRLYIIDHFELGDIL